MLVASMSISGVPPFNGFVSKWMIYAGLLQFAFAPSSSALGPAAVVFLVAAMFGSALTLASFVKILHSAFMGAPTRECQGAREVGWLMYAPMLFLAFACVLLGVAPAPTINAFLAPIAQEAGLPAVAGGLWDLSFGLGLKPVAGGLWSPMLAAGLILVALAGGAAVFLLGTFRKARTARPFHSGETTMFTAEEMRFPGTGFYGTVLELGTLRTIYRDAAEGAYDLYEIVGHAGERLVGLGKELHNGVLPTYLGFCMLGLLAVLAALLLPLLLG
jgi:NADH:ubiquinone oxidoreductase subunit 5 (subunit L)/multisubunit Na+/H+ antiporter MnhA subunit